MPLNGSVKSKLLSRSSERSIRSFIPFIPTHSFQSKGKWSHIIRIYGGTFRNEFRFIDSSKHTSDVIPNITSLSLSYFSYRASTDSTMNGLTAFGTKISIILCGWDPWMKFVYVCTNENDSNLLSTTGAFESAKVRSMADTSLEYPTKFSAEVTFNQSISSFKSCFGCPAAFAISKAVVMWFLCDDKPQWWTALPLIAIALLKYVRDSAESSWKWAEAEPIKMHTTFDSDRISVARC